MDKSKDLQSGKWGENLVNNYLKEQGDLFTKITDDTCKTLESLLYSTDEVKLFTDEMDKKKLISSVVISDKEFNPRSLTPDDVVVLADLTDQEFEDQVSDFNDSDTEVNDSFENNIMKSAGGFFDRFKDKYGTQFKQNVRGVVWDFLKYGPGGANGWDLFKNIADAFFDSLNTTAVEQIGYLYKNNADFRKFYNILNENIKSNSKSDIVSGINKIVNDLITKENNYSYYSKMVSNNIDFNTAIDLVNNLDNTDKKGKYRKLNDLYIKVIDGTKDKNISLDKYKTLINEFINEYTNMAKDSDSKGNKSKNKKRKNVAESIFINNINSILIADEVNNTGTQIEYNLDNKVAVNLFNVLTNLLVLLLGRNSGKIGEILGVELKKIKNGNKVYDSLIEYVSGVESIPSDLSVKDNKIKAALDLYLNINKDIENNLSKAIACLLYMINISVASYNSIQHKLSYDTNNITDILNDYVKKEGQPFISEVQNDINTNKKLNEIKLLKNNKIVIDEHSSKTNGLVLKYKNILYTFILDDNTIKQLSSDYKKDEIVKNVIASITNKSTKIDIYMYNICKLLLSENRDKYFKLFVNKTNTDTDTDTDNTQTTNTKNTKSEDNTGK